MRNLFSTHLAKVAAVLIVLLGSWALSSCLTEPKFSFTPSISFKGIRRITVNTTDALGNKGQKDSVIISIHFEDGDGDLGLSQEQQNGKDWKGLNNYIVETLVKKGTIWELKKADDGEILNLSSIFFPLRKSTDKNGPIEGTLDFFTVFLLKQSNPTAIRDFVKFNIYIIDNNHNISGTITTDSVAVYR
jgi:hypothetical protein